MSDAHSNTATSFCSRLLSHYAWSTADDKRTCLHLAASMGNIHLVTALVEQGADINFQDRWGGTPLADSMREGHVKVSACLRESGAEFKYDSVTAASQLMVMARAGDQERIAQLLEGNCDVDSPDHDLRTCAA